MATIFFTGATGFVGGATLAALLDDPHVEKVITLVRARDEVHGRERLELSLRRFRPGAPDARVQLLVGSLETWELADLTPITHVLHCAAHTSFRSVRTARETNVDGTLRLAARFSGSRSLERLLFVGTAYRLGRAKVSGVVDEDEPSAQEHCVEYTRTKAEAESLLEAAGLPVVIARPSIVIGHTMLGVAPSASLYWYYRALAVAGVAPFQDDRMRDIVPVDWVASALVHLLLKPDLMQARYHLSAGEGSAVTWAAIREVFAPGTRSALLTLEQLEAHPAWAAAGLDAWTIGAIAACAKFSSLSYDVFSNRRVLAEGISPSPPFTRYLARSDRSIAAQARDDV